MEQPKKDLENIKLKLIEHINANYEKDQAKNLVFKRNNSGRLIVDYKDINCFII